MQSFMRTNNPALSICVPTYNRAHLLTECLQSIVASREGYEQEVEIVVSDNASTDDTARVVREFQNKNNNIRYYCNTENIGASPNIVKVAQLGRGRYVWVFADDDKVDKRAVPTVIERISYGCNLVVLNFSCHSLDFSRKLKSSYYSTHLPQRFNDHDLLLKTFGTTLSLISAIVMPRSIVQRCMDARLQVGINYEIPFLPAIYVDMAKQCHVEFVPDALVMNRSGNTDYDINAWIQVFCKNMALLVEELRTEGYSSASIRRAKSITVRYYILWRIISQKMDGSAWWNIYEESWKYYRSTVNFWLLCLPLAPVPGFFLRTIRYYLARRLIRL